MDDVLWRVESENIDESGLLVSVYKPSNREIADFLYTAKFPSVNLSVQGYILRDDFNVDISKYERLPEEFVRAAVTIFERQSPEYFHHKIFERLIYPAFLELSNNVAKTRPNLEDIGYTFH